MKRVILQIWSDRIRVINPDTGAREDHPALVAIQNNEVVAIGNDAESHSNPQRPFDHPRTLAGDFDTACVLFKWVLSAYGIKRWWQRSSVELQLMERIEGGMTALERRFFTLSLKTVPGVRQVMVVGNQPADIVQSFESF